jgi:undecaprenyl-diphosphatase
LSDERQESLEILEAEPKVAAGIGFGAIAVAVALLSVFAWIADEVAHSATLRFDYSVRNYVHQFASPTVTACMQALSIIGGQVLTALTMIVPLVLWWRGKRRAALWLIVTTLGALVLDVALKFAFHRQRPTPFFGGLPTTYSFPSGHSLFSFCFFGTLAGLMAARTSSRPLKVIIYVSAALLVFSIGLSRIYLGVHYPTDVAAGFLAAGIWVTTVVILDRWRIRRKSNR